MFDSHTHVDTIRCEDVELMAVSGIKRLMLCLGPNGSSVYTTLLDYYEQLLTTHSSKVRDRGIMSYVALGVHPMSIPKDFSEALKHLPRYLERNSVVAIGEIGIHSGSDLEASVFRLQVEMAKDHDVPIIIHTPIPEKKRIVETMLGIIRDVGLDPRKALVDHSTKEVAKQISDFGANIGLTLRRDILSSEDAYEILRSYPERIVLGSDANGLRPSDPLAVPRFAHYCRLKGTDEGVMRKVLWENPNRIFSLE
jgi:predicted metal-dependent TIM-barrel fold hydrolase